jgi:hypothetical protein
MTATRKKIEALIISKTKGEVAQVKEEKPKKPSAKSMMEMLRETAEEQNSLLLWVLTIFID